MRAIWGMLQVMSLSLAVILILKGALFLRNRWRKTVFGFRKRYNEKHGLPSYNGIAEPETGRSSCRMDSVEGGFAALILFLAGLMLTLAVLVLEEGAFGVGALTLSAAAFVYGFLVCSFGTARYRVLAYLAYLVTLPLIAHILASLILGLSLWFPYSQSAKILLYVWTALFWYRWLWERKPEKAVC